jgi:hypothetical protein
VYGSARFDQASVEAKIAKPAATISGPRRLSGRRHHAISPPKMYGSMIQTISVACRPGSLTWSLVSASANEVAAAARPANASPTTMAGLGFPTVQPPLRPSITRDERRV